MFLPLSDAPNPQRVPWMTYALIAANVAVFVLFSLPLGITPASRADPRLAEYVAAIREALPPDVPLAEALGQITAYDLFVFEHGFRPAAAEGIDLLTSMFLHGGFMHLFGNMLFLWIYGDNVEYRLGRLRYLLAYLVTGVAATLFFTLLSPDSTLPLVGASGAISGVLGFYFLWFPLNVVRVLVFLFPILMRVFEIPARIVLGFYLVWDNILPLIFTAGQGGGGVAHGAHIGGFVAGLAGAWAMDRATTTARPPEYASAPAFAPAPSAIEAAIGRGDMEVAARAYFAAAEPDPLPPAATLALANWLATHGHDDAALIVYRRFIRDHGREPGAAEAQLGAGLVELRRGQLAPAYQHLRASLERDPDPVTRARAVEALRAIARQQKYPMPRYEGGMGS
jgi:membrane associated rhomboid family serine protease